MKILDKKDLLNLLKGSSILSAGGGGSIEEAENILEELEIEEIQLADPDDLRPEEKALTCYGVGSTNSDNVNEIQSIDTAVEAYKSEVNNTIDAVFPTEIGPLAIMDAIIASKKFEVPLLNLDAADGRCVPRVDMSPLKNLQEAKSSYLITHESGEVMKVDQDTPLIELEETARSFATEKKSIVFVTGHTHRIGKISGSLKKGTPEKAMEIGQNSKSIQMLEQETDLEFLITGSIESVSVNEKNSNFFESEIIVSTEKSEIRIETENEFTKLEMEGGKTVESPETIIILDLDSLEGIYTGEKLEGREVAVFKKQPEGFWKTPEGKKILEEL